MWWGLWSGHRDVGTPLEPGLEVGLRWCQYLGVQWLQQYWDADWHHGISIAQWSEVGWFCTCCWGVLIIEMYFFQMYQPFASCIELLREVKCPKIVCILSNLNQVVGGSWLIFTIVCQKPTCIFHIVSPPEKCWYHQTVDFDNTPGHIEYTNLLEQTFQFCVAYVY